VNDGLPSSGIAVDLACGSARDGVFLSLRGWTTHNFDYAEGQITKATHLASLYSVSHLVNFHVVDVGKDIDIIVEKYPADLVNVSRYLNRAIFQAIKKLVKPGGFIVFHTFMESCKKPRKEQFKLKESELKQVFGDQFEIIEDKIFNISDGRPTSWFCARKKR